MTSLIRAITGALLLICPKQTIHLPLYRTFEEIRFPSPVSSDASGQAQVDYKVLQ